ncbi:MAG: hypothetical protein DRR00_02950 [Candidatus Parabeggiatoa sp. nov. 3]|nr:MAG: hypothetical protein DRR00_02950 [Gammaproteobacteria bacterium]RKZ69164.1 MAG: hypothetical protein DRQ99_01770 [Gammaproteobacteria bacterium]
MFRKLASRLQLGLRENKFGTKFAPKQIWFENWAFKIYLDKQYLGRDGGIAVGRILGQLFNSVPPAYPPYEDH